MSSYFTNSYLRELQGEPDHYTSQQSRGCDPLRQLSHHYGNDVTGSDIPPDGDRTGVTYPRFPPFDRLDIRPITSQPQYGFNTACDPLEDNGASQISQAPHSHQQSQMNGVLGHQAPPQQYTSCKLQPASQASPVAAASPPEDASIEYQSQPQNLQQQQQQTAQTGQSGNVMPIYKWMRETNCEYLR